MRRKQTIYKRIAVFIALCYVVNLLQYQIVPVIHSISHLLEAPTDLVSHNSLSMGIIEDHGHFEHGKVETLHQHELIDLINFVVAFANDKDDSGESVITEIKFDKHMRFSRDQKAKFYEPDKAKPLFWSGPEKLNSGHFEIAPEPPRSS